MVTFGKSPSSPFAPPKSPATPPKSPATPPKSPATPPKSPVGGGGSSGGGGGGGSSGGTISFPLSPTPIFNDKGILVGINDPRQQKTLLPTASDYLKYGGAPPQKSSGTIRQVSTLAPSGGNEMKTNAGLKSTTPELKKIGMFGEGNFSPASESKRDQSLYTQIFRNQEQNIKVLDYDDKGNPLSFSYNNKNFSGSNAIDKLTDEMNKVTERKFEREKIDEEIREKGFEQFAKDKTYKDIQGKIENARQKTFLAIDILANAKIPTKEQKNEFAKKMGLEVEELNKLDGLSINKQKDEVFKRILVDADKLKDKTKAEFVKGAVDDIFDLANIVGLGVYSTASDKRTRQEVGGLVLASLIAAPKTYLSYLKNDPLGGSAFTIGSIVGIGGILKGVTKTGKAVSKSVIASNINKAITEVETLKKLNLDKLKKGGFNVNKLSDQYGIDFAKVVNGLEDASSIGLDIKLNQVSPKYKKAWEMFEGVGEVEGKISPKILKQFSDKTLKKMDIKVKASAETELTGGVLRKLGKRIQDFSDGKIITTKTKGLTFEADQIPTGRIIGKKTGKNYIDNFIVEADKSFSGTAKRIMRGGDVVEQKYYTQGIGTIVREFYVNGKLKYTVTQARKGGRVVVKSGKDIVLKSLNQPKLTKNLELIEDTWKEIRKKAIVSDIQSNFKGRILNITKQFNYIKVTPLKKTFGLEIKMLNNSKMQKITILTPAQIVKSQSDIFADFMKKRKTVMLAQGYVSEVNNLKSMIVPEYIALRKTLRSSQLTGVFKRNPTLLDKTRSFISRLNESADRIINLKMNKRASGRLYVGGPLLTVAQRANKYLQDYKYANEVKIDYAKPLQNSLEKSIGDMSRVLNAFQNNKSVAFGIRSSWATRLIKLKLQAEYLKYLNTQKILTAQEYSSLTRLDSKVASKTKSQMQTKQQFQSKLALDTKLRPKDTKFPDMKMKMDFDLMKFPKLGDENKRRFVDKVLGSKKASSYVVLLGSGKKQRIVSKRLKPAEAISYGAYLTDKKGDRTVRIVPAKGKPNQRFKIDYLAQAQGKFRNYRIKKGKKVKYSSARLIEKRKYFNDLEKLHKLKGGGKNANIRRTKKRNS